MSAGLSAAQAPQHELAALDQIAGGRWELRPRGDRSEVERICVKDGKGLIQLRHPGLNCERLVVDDDPSSVTVQYTCPGRGYGRTFVRRETSHLVQIQTQGVANGLPFDFAAEGRRIGECP